MDRFAHLGPCCQSLPLALSISLSVVYLAMFAPSVSASEDEPSPVRTAQVTVARMAESKIFIGTVQPARRSLIGAAVAGRVDRVFVETGDLVSNDGQLVQFRIKAVEIRLASAKADLEVAEQELAELVEGPRKEDLQRLKARDKSAAAVEAYAAKRFERLKTLIARGATAQGNLDEALSSKLAAEQNHAAAKAEYEAAIAGTRKEQLAQARAKVSKAEEEWNRIQDELNEHNIKAPFKGYVVKRFVERGEWLQVGDPIAEMIELDPAEVRVSVPEDFITMIKRDQNVTIDVASIRQQGEKRDLLIGSVFRIIPDADSRSRSFPVRIRLKNPMEDQSPLLKPGMLAKVYLPVGRKREVSTVPNDALVMDRDRAYLFFVKRNGDRATVARVEVEIGSTFGSLIQVKPLVGSSIESKAEVVVEGNERLETGQAVSVLETYSPNP